jgi:DNA-binding LacI/PurR family transcriptional regulator
MAAYALEVMRKLLENGEWRDTLPGERTLALRIGVSRPSLHEALLVLKKEGKLQQRTKAAWRIQVDVPNQPNGVRKVIFLSPFDLEEFEPFSLHQYTLLNGHLSERGYDLEAVRLASVKSAKPERFLRKLTQELRPSAWVLYQCGQATLEWFAQSGLPVVVMGSAPAKFKIRSVDVDYRAAAHHAASTLLRLGHKAESITYIMPKDKLIGHTEAMAGIRSATGKNTSQIASISEDIPELRAQLKQILLSKPKPTALIIHRPLQALSIIGCLTQSGIQVPRDMSIVLLDDNPILSHLVPTPSRYHKNTANFTSHLQRAIDHATGVAGHENWVTRIIPELIPGETLSGPLKEETKG